MRTSILLVIASASLVFGATFDRPCPSDVTVKQDFDLPAYLGLWYEQQRYLEEFQFEGDCVNAEYSANENGTVRVLNSLVILGEINNSLSIEGWAIPTFPQQMPLTGKFNVTFNNDADRSNYWVLDTDYVNFAVVWSCMNMQDNRSRESAWILSRQSTLNEDVQGTVDALIEQFLDRSLLRPTNQKQENCLGDLDPFVQKA